MTANVHIIEHPLIQHKLTMIRDKTTEEKEFRELIKEISTLICYEAAKDLPLKEVEIETPVGVARTKAISGRKFAFVPIYRAGLGMVEGVLQLIPPARVGHIGIYRDPATHKAVDYYCKLPYDIDERDVYLLDPMVATGVSVIAAVDKLKESGVKKIKLICILASAKGIEALTKAHPDVEVYCAAVDDTLDDCGYIKPGMGDAGDRMFGTR